MRLPYVDNPPTFSDANDQAIVQRVQQRRGERGLIPLDLALLHSPPVADGWYVFWPKGQLTCGFKTGLLTVVAGILFSAAFVPKPQSLTPSAKPPSAASPRSTAHGSNGTHTPRYSSERVSSPKPAWSTSSNRLFTRQIARQTAVAWMRNTLPCWRMPTQ